MRPQNPIDKWFKKQTILTFACILGYLVLSFVLGQVFSYHVFIYMTIPFMLLITIMNIYSVHWNIKHPYKPEFCKECGQAKPEKFEE